MPDSLPLFKLVRDPARAAVRAQAAANAPLNVPAGASTADGKGCVQGRMLSPPRDVVHLLAQRGTALPQYYDLQRARDAASAAEHWPLLRTAQCGGAL